MKFDFSCAAPKRNLLMTFNIILKLIPDQWTILVPQDVKIVLLSQITHSSLILNLMLCLLFLSSQFTMHMSNCKSFVLLTCCANRLLDCNSTPRISVTSITRKFKVGHPPTSEGSSSENYWNASYIPVCIRLRGLVAAKQCFIWIWWVSGGEKGHTLSTMQDLITPLNASSPGEHNVGIKNCMLHKVPLLVLLKFVCQVSKIHNSLIFWGCTLIW